MGTISHRFTRREHTYLIFKTQLSITPRSKSSVLLFGFLRHENSSKAAFESPLLFGIEIPAMLMKEGHYLYF